VIYKKFQIELIYFPIADFQAYRYCVVNVNSKSSSKMQAYCTPAKICTES
jgi:hypothetical protein